MAAPVLDHLTHARVLELVGLESARYAAMFEAISSAAGDDLAARFALFVRDQAAGHETANHLGAKQSRKVNALTAEVEALRANVRAEDLEEIARLNALLSCFRNLRSNSGGGQ